MDVHDHAREAGWQPVAMPGELSGRWSVWRVPETGSTNADLLDLVAAGVPDRTVLMTDHQTAGRGRLDRRWDAPPGTNLLVSIVFRDVPSIPGDLTRLVGVAAVDAVAHVAAVDARLKWPNDVLVGDAKLAGVLAQRAPDGPVVVGIGLNVGWAPDGAAMLGIGYRPRDVLTAMLGAIDAISPDELDARYRGVLATLGTRVRVQLESGDVTGRAVDVERDGTLVVVDECAITHRVDAGDVVHLRRDLA